MKVATAWQRASCDIVRDIDHIVFTAGLKQGHTTDRTNINGVAISSGIDRGVANMTRLNQEVITATAQVDIEIVLAVIVDSVRTISQRCAATGQAASNN